MNTETIHIVDQGRGPQLSTSRITVLDLAPYFQKGSSFEEISRWIPSLGREEIEVAERFYLAHKGEFDERDRKVREHRAERIRQQRSRFPELNGSKEERLAHLRRLLEERRQEKNREGNPG